MKDVVQARGFEGDELFNVAANVAQSTRFTAYYNPNKGECVHARDASTSIDHILVSKGLQESHEVALLQWPRYVLHLTLRADYKV